MSAQGTGGAVRNQGVCRCRHLVVVAGAVTTGTGAVHADAQLHAGVSDRDDLAHVFGILQIQSLCFLPAYHMGEKFSIFRQALLSRLTLGQCLQNDDPDMVTLSLIDVCYTLRQASRTRKVAVTMV